jgi:hypothetical protein
MAELADKVGQAAGGRWRRAEVVTVGAGARLGERQVRHRGKSAADRGSAAPIGGARWGVAVERSTCKFLLGNYDPQSRVVPRRLARSERRLGHPRAVAASNSEKIDRDMTGRNRADQNRVRPSVKCISLPAERQGIRSFVETACDECSGVSSNGLPSAQAADGPIQDGTPSNPIGT